MCKIFAKRVLDLGSKNTGTHKYPENFAKNFIIGTTAYRRLKPSSVSSTVIQ